MLKYSSLLIKIKLFYLILTRKFKKLNEPIIISNNQEINVKNILIIFPVKDEDFRVALYVFRKLSILKDINYYYLINCIHRQHFHLKAAFFVKQAVLKTKNRKPFWTEAISLERWVSRSLFVCSTSIF